MLHGRQLLKKPKIQVLNQLITLFSQKKSATKVDVPRVPIPRGYIPLKSAVSLRN